MEINNIPSSHLLPIKLMWYGSIMEANDHHRWPSSYHHGAMTDAALKPYVICGHIVDDSSCLACGGEYSTSGNKCLGSF